MKQVIKIIRANKGKNYQIGDKGVIEDFIYDKGNCGIRAIIVLENRKYVTLPLDDIKLLYYIKDTDLIKKINNECK